MLLRIAAPHMGITLASAGRVRQLARLAREQDIMRRPRRAVILITAAMAAIGPAATTAAAVASVSRGRSTAQAVTAHIGGPATIRVGRFPVGVAGNPRADTHYVANANRGTGV